MDAIFHFPVPEMSVNSSSAADYHLHPNHPSNKTYVSPQLYCFFSKPSSLIFISYNITNIILLLPLSIFILYHGLQQWRSTSSAASVSHSDSFTYHMVTMELIRVIASTLCCGGVYSDNVNALLMGIFLLALTWYGEIFFHTLTCVERYLAVVHPITYMSLRKERGVRIRNITIGCVWVVCFALMGLIVIEIVFVILNFLILILSFAVISFCSFSVLLVLIRSGPGDQVGRKEKVDQSKLRAFYTIVAILGVLLLRLAWDMGWVVLYTSGGSGHCVLITRSIWFNLPSSLVLPLLFLHRAGKLDGCKK